MNSSLQNPIRLWDGAAPGALGNEAHDTPQIKPYLPNEKNATRAAMLILPGGGYNSLAAHEGEDYALFLNSLGVSCFVLQYRLGKHGYRHPAMLQDASRALRLIRTRAAEWDLDTEKIGVMGSSAGGHLATTLLTHYDSGDANSADFIERESSRPALGVLCYAVISMGPHAHEGSKAKLLGENPAPELVQFLSNELHVNSQTPPCFVWHTGEDKSVKLDNSWEFVAALLRHDVPFDFHVYQKGRHGIGLADKAPFENAHPWSHDLAFWLREQNFLAEN